MYYQHNEIYLNILTDGNALLRIEFCPKTAPTPPVSQLEAQIKAELDAYFSGTLKSFSIPYTLSGTDFQKRCWQALTTIPYGETISYAELASRVGSPKAYRAVGNANHHNPLPIIIPCHRVIGSGGELRGFAGGLGIKQALLDIERS